MYHYNMVSFIFWGEYPEKIQLGQMKLVFLVFGGTSILISTAVVLVYFPTRNVYGFNFPHTVSALLFLSLWQ